MAYPASAAFRASLTANSQAARSVVQVWHGNQRLATLPSVTTGSVTVTETAEIRSTCTLSVQSQGRTRDDLVPKNPTDLLHPVSGNELRIYRGFRYATGITELVPLGVFRLTKPVITDTPTGLAITLNGYDRAGEVQRQAFSSPFVIATGTQLNTVCMTVVGSRIPTVAFNLYPLTAKLPALTWAATPDGSTNDPMLLLQSAYADYGMELYFDVTGICTSRPIPTASKTPVSWTYSEGEDCTLTQVAKTLDETSTYNGVVYIGNGAAKTTFSTPTPTHNLGFTELTIPPVVGEVWTTTPTSPINVTRWGKVPYIVSTTLIPGPSQNDSASAQAAIDAAAQAQFPLVATQLNEVTFACVPNPAMQCGDVVMLNRARAGIATPLVVAGFTIPLGPGTAETVPCRPQTQAV